MATGMEPSHNGRGSDTWCGSWTHLGVDRQAPGYARITFDHPPVNAMTATMADELAELIGLIEEDPDLNVVVFASANPHAYLSHYDAGREAPRMRSWPDALGRLSRAPVVSIAAMRGSVRGTGSEFALACDLRFASRENTLIGRPDLAVGAATLPRVVGHGRALEILLASGELDGSRAERYGLVNRAIADELLDDEVDEIAWRLAGLDHDAVAHTKACVGRAPEPA
jgi:enoyl-CoA hydratase/carnithine racemase